MKFRPLSSSPRSQPSANPKPRPKAKTSAATKIVYSRRSSGWVDWRILSRMFGDELARGREKHKVEAVKVAKARQKELDAEIAARPPAPDRHAATKVDIQPRMERSEAHEN